MQRNPEFSRVILQKKKKKENSSEKPYRCPPETFLPVTKFLLGRKNMPSVLEQRTCQLDRKFAATEEGGTGV